MLLAEIQSLRGSGPRFSPRWRCIICVSDLCSQAWGVSPASRPTNSHLGWKTRGGPWQSAALPV